MTNAFWEDDAPEQPQVPLIKLPDPEDFEDPFAGPNDELSPEEQFETEVMFGPPDELAEMDAASLVDEQAHPVMEPEAPDAMAIHGPMNAWAGRVHQTHYDRDGGHPELGTTQGIDVEIVDVFWDGNNAPTLYPRPQALHEPTQMIFPANPLPVREDQAKYHVQEGDDVTLLLADDGQAWFLSDELPFLAKVTLYDADTVSEHEDNNGGAGTHCVSVQRLALSGDPDSSAFNWSDDNVSVLSIYYPRVLIVRDATMHPGYRVDSRIFVHRRGRYFFAMSQRESWHGLTVAGGPDGEDDFPYNAPFYWVAERYMSVEYAMAADMTVGSAAGWQVDDLVESNVGGSADWSGTVLVVNTTTGEVTIGLTTGNASAIDLADGITNTSLSATTTISETEAAQSNSYEIVDADVSPAGHDLRWIQAVNLPELDDTAEDADAKLPVGTHVVVHQYNDASDDDPYYVIERELLTTGPSGPE